MYKPRPIWLQPLTVGLFTLLGFITLNQHALWRDEFNPWLIVRDSTSWLDLWQNVRYEGHPLLWYGCLLLLHTLTQNFANNFVSMQWFHLAIGIGSVILLWRYSPFRPIEKVLITFGYFPFFEYLIISRNYSLGLFFSFLFCTLFPRRRRHYWPLAIVLGLLANSHAYGLFIAIFLGLMLAVEWIFDRAHRQTYQAEAPIWDGIFSVAVVLVSYGLAAYMISPPSTSYLHGGSRVFASFDWHRLLVSIGSISSAYLMIVPNAKRWFDLIAMDTLTLGIITLVGLKLSRKPWVLLFFGLSTLTITIAFFYLKSLISPRHVGSLYVVLLTSLWLAQEADSPQPIRLKISPRLYEMADRWFQRIFVVILVLHCAMGVYMVGREFFQPYSASRAATQYIQAAGLQNEFIFASRDAQMAPISGYLNRKLYYPELRDYGSFTLFKEGRKSLSPTEALEAAIELLQGKNSKITPVPSNLLFVSSTELDLKASSPTLRSLEILPIQAFKRSWSREEYYLYWINLR